MNFVYNVTVHFIKEEFNTDKNNMFKFMQTILGTVVEMERELTVEQIREGMTKAELYCTRSGRPALYKYIEEHESGG